MEGTANLIDKLSNELPATAVGVGTLVMYVAFVDLTKDSQFILSISWIERIILVLVLSYILGKIFTYLGYFIVLFLSSIVHYRNFKIYILEFIDELKLMKPGNKSVSMFKNNLLLLPEIYKFIGENESVHKMYIERVASMSFCLSLLGAVISAPYFINKALYNMGDYQLIIFFSLLLAFNSLMNRNKFYGHCAKAHSKESK